MNSKPLSRTLALRLYISMAQDRLDSAMSEARDNYDYHGNDDPDVAYYLGMARQESRLIQRYRRELRKAEGKDR